MAQLAGGHSWPIYYLYRSQNLKYLKSAKCLNPCQARWALYFTRFNFTLSYRPGSKNTKADSLSCIHPSDSQDQGQESTLSPSVFCSCFHLGFWWGDHQFPRTSGPPNQIFCSQSCQPAMGDPGSQHTYNLLKEKYRWPNMLTEINQYISSYTVCAQAKGPTQSAFQ